MIIGNGLLAQAFAEFRDDARVLIYAAGVSDSLETDPAAFARERARLVAARAEHPDMLLVYFGTCSANDPDRRDTPYVVHKLEMEALLERHAGPWMVLRLPLAIGPSRAGRTLAPFLYESISQGRKFEIWEHATRYPIDVADVVRIGRRFIATPGLWRRRINVALRAFPVRDLVREMERIVGKTAHFDDVPKGRHYAVDCPEVESIAAELGLDYSDGYLGRLLARYFAD